MDKKLKGILYILAFPGLITMGIFFSRLSLKQGSSIALWEHLQDISNIGGIGLLVFGIKMLLSKKS